MLGLTLESALTARSRKRLKSDHKYRRLLRGRGSKLLRVGLVLCAFTFIVILQFVVNNVFVEAKQGFFAGARRLMSAGSQATCTNGLDMVGAPDSKGWLAIPIYLIVVLWFFVGLAAVTDDYFVPALVVISEKLSLSPDVAGATFMAAGSSAPELFTSLADVFTVSNSTGIGTIVGSAVFNILVIIACAGAFAKSSLDIDWRPMARDVSFYLTSILLLYIFVQGWGSAPAPLHSFQYSRGDAVAEDYDIYAANGGDLSSGTEAKVWYKDDKGNEFSEKKPLSFNEKDNMTVGAACCDEISEDGTYCKTLSPNGGRLRYDNDMPYFVGEGKGLVKGKSKCNALIDSQGVCSFNAGGAAVGSLIMTEEECTTDHADAATNSWAAYDNHFNEQITTKLTYQEETDTYCCDPVKLGENYSFIGSPFAADTDDHSVRFVTPVLDKINQKPSCPVAAPIWECACNSGGTQWPTKYVHGKPMCEGALGYEGKVWWWEALIMFLSYGFYILFMTKNKYILDKCREKPKEFQTASDKRKEYKEELDAGEHEPNEFFSGSDAQVSDGQVEMEVVGDNSDKKKAEKGTPSEDVDTTTGVIQADSDKAPVASGNADTDGDKSDEKEPERDDDDEEGGQSGMVKCLNGCFCICASPWSLMFKYTVPDCNFEDEGEELQEQLEAEGKTEAEVETLMEEAKKNREKWYILSFICSILWIGGMSLVMVLFVNWLGCLMGLSSIIMSVTLLAIGTSVPDALGSIISAREGMGDMAVANAIGSNVFDILLGLGFPYMLYGWIRDKPYCVDTAGVTVHLIILFMTVISTISIFCIMRWKLNMSLGIIMLVLYAGFLVYSIVAGVQQYDEAQICETHESAIGKHLGHGHFLRNTADAELYEIYGSTISDGAFNYDPTEVFECRDVCGNRFADNENFRR